MIEVEWDNDDKTIVLWKFSSPWTWNEFFAAKTEMDNMIDSTDGIVDSILITSREQKIPSNALTNLRNLIYQIHERNDLVVLVGSKPFLTTLLNLIISVVPNARERFRFVINKADAYAAIEQARQKRSEATTSATPDAAP